MSAFSGAAPATGAAPAIREPMTPRFVREIGGMVYLAYVALARGLRPPYSWAPEFVSQLRFTIKICFIPMMLTSFALSFGPAGIQEIGRAHV